MVSTRTSPPVAIEQPLAVRYDKRTGWYGSSSGSKSLALSFNNLSLVNATFGFLPASRREIQHSKDLILHIGKSSFVAPLFLGEIATHQKDDPKPAVEFITRAMAEYAKKARRDLSLLQQLDIRFGDLGNVSDDLPVSSVELYRGERPVVRYLDLLGITQGKLPKVNPFMDPKPNEADPSDPYTIHEHRPDMAGYFTGLLGDISLGQIKATMDPAIDEQEVRRGFWVERLQEAMYYDPARRIADIALQDLSVNRPY